MRPRVVRSRGVRSAGVGGRAAWPGRVGGRAAWPGRVGGRRPRGAFAVVRPHLGGPLGRGRQRVGGQIDRARLGRHRPRLRLADRFRGHPYRVLGRYRCRQRGQIVAQFLGAGPGGRIVGHADTQHVQQVLGYPGQVRDRKREDRAIPLP